MHDRLRLESFMLKVPDQTYKQLYLLTRSKSVE